MAKRGRKPKAENLIMSLRADVDAKDRVIDMLRIELAHLKDKLRLINDVSKMIGD